MIYKKFLLYFICLLFLKTNCLKIDRVILSTDNNPNYIEFWPIVAKLWKDVIGVKPTLALIADKSVKIDDSLGDVIRFEPISGISNGSYAQCVRLLLPAYFENEVCIISDIDMLPLNKDYFVNSIKGIPDDCFVNYKNGCYERDGSFFKYPMCYNVAKGNIFKDIFGINHINDIPEIIRQWMGKGYGWNTDEIILHKSLQKWQHYKTRFIRLGHLDKDRIDRYIFIDPGQGEWSFEYEDQLLQNNFYVDAHCPRPYHKYRKEIDALSNKVIAKSELEKQNKFVIIVQSFNNEKWCIKNLESILNQDYDNYCIIYINNYSADQTGKIVQEHLKLRNLTHKCWYVENSEYRYPLENIYQYVHACKNNEIIVLLDGKDWLVHESVLSILDKKYKNSDILLTYGQYIDTNGIIGCCTSYPENIIRERSYRQDDCRASHLITFKAFLFKHICKEDLMHEEKFFDMAWEHAFMFPMLEMVGNKFCFIDQILYVYNLDDPIRNVNKNRYNFLDGFIKKMQPYDVLQ